MDRRFIYPSQVPLDTYFLNVTKDAMVGLGVALKAILGTSTFFDGLACSATAPASMQVSIGAGSVYSLQNIDNSVFGSLAADTAHQIVKQGLSLDPVLLPCPAPSGSGQSINYLVQAAYQDSDTGSQVLSYYNSANPNVPFAGPGGLGGSNYTVRQGLCAVNVKAGVAAATGSQTTPAADTGYTALYVVTVANGQTSITSANFSTVGGAPFISERLGDKISETTADARYLQTANPVATGSLSVTTTGNGLIASGSSAGNTIGVSLNNLSGHQWIVGSVGSSAGVAANALQFYDNTSGGTRAWIDSKNMVSIGTDTMNTIGFKLTNTAGHDWILGSIGGSNATYPNGVWLYDNTSGGASLVIDSSGNLFLPRMGNSASTNGYVKLPNGYIFQWGYQATTNNTFNFPITFPNACLNFTASNASAQGTYVDNAFGYASSTSQFFLATKQSQNASSNTAYPCYWSAIGN